MSMYRTFDAAIMAAKVMLRDRGKSVAASHWQGMDVSGKPDMVTHELMNHSFTAWIDPDLDKLRKQIEPNLPWADDHFLERVGGLGINPGVQYANWPYYVNKANDKFRTEGGKFSHSYMERIWPNDTDETESMKIHGIRYNYGDLDDVVDLLKREPLTRQAFLPIWYPEDTGAVHGGRVPCTLGYHFMMRDNQLHMFYPIRACDYIRHFRDDIYLACRLLLWVLDRLKMRDEGFDPILWQNVTPGTLTMQIYSLHVFAAEKHMLSR